MPGKRVFDKSADGLRVRFVNCSWKSPWASTSQHNAGPRAAILLQLHRPQITKKLGGVDFIDCTVYDAVNRPMLLVRLPGGDYGVQDLTGRITLHSPHDARMELGPNANRIDLQIGNAVE